MFIQLFRVHFHQIHYLLRVYALYVSCYIFKLINAMDLSSGHLDFERSNSF
jgi:hypothetical protein